MSGSLGLPLSRGIVVALSLLVSSPGMAADPEPTVAESIQEVFLGELVFPQEEGELQLSLGAAVEDGDTEASLVVEWGVSDAFQVEIELEGVVDGDVDGFGSVELGGHYAFMNVRPNVHLGLGAALAWAPEEVGDVPRDAVFVEPVVILATDLAEGRWHLFAQLSAEWLLDEGDLQLGFEEPEDEAELAFGAVTATRWGGWTLEAAAGRALGSDGDDLDESDETAWSLAMGVVIVLSDAWQLGVGGVLGVDGDAEDAWLVSLTVEP